VLDARPLFDPGNLEASRSPKVRVRRSDAYRALLQSEGSYDLIVSEPSNPWVTGVEMLYSIEFLEAARHRLAPGGVYAQWFHSYEVDDESVELVLRNYASVFPHVSVWYTLSHDLILLGFDRPDRALDVAALEERFQKPDFEAGFKRIGIWRFPMLLAHELLPIGIVDPQEIPGPLHTLRHPILSYGAARAFFRGSTAALPRFTKPGSGAVGARNSLLRRYARADAGPFPEQILEDAAVASCGSARFDECATFLALWRRDHPDSARLSKVLTELRTGAGTGDGVLGDRSLDLLVVLHGGGDGKEAGGDRSPQRARSLSEGYLRHYSHAAPFDRRVLEKAWRGCRGEPCAELRRKLESRLGPLGEGGRSSLGEGHARAGNG
jgi:hypothetical protein